MGKLTNKRSKPDLCIDSTDCNIELQNKYGQVGYAILVRAVLDYTELLQLEYFNINIEDLKHSEFKRIKQKYEDMMSAKDFLYHNLWTYNLDFDRLTRMLRSLIYQNDGHLLENYNRFYTSLQELETRESRKEQQIDLVTNYLSAYCTKENK